MTVPIVVPLLNHPERAPVDPQDNLPVLDNEDVNPEMEERHGMADQPEREGPENRDQPTPVAAATRPVRSLWSTEELAS